MLIGSPTLVPLLIRERHIVVVPFTIADATCNFSVHPGYMANDISAFGLKGKEAVLKFLANELGTQAQLGLPAYKLADPFQVHEKKKMVSLGFECLIEGYQGFGTDCVYLDDNNLIREIDARRHRDK